MWMLSLNANMCVVLIISRDTTAPYHTYHVTVRGTAMQMNYVDSTRDLGVIVDERLSFTDYVNEKII